MEPEIIVDIFNSDVFSATVMTDSINEMAYVPQFLTSMDIFEVDGIPTTSAYVVKRGEQLDLVQTSQRGASGSAIDIDERKAFPLQSVHLKLEDRITSEAIQNTISFNSPMQLQTMEELRDDRLRRMSRRLDFTLEYHKLGAIQGMVLDANGEVLLDLFDKFDIAQPAVVPMQLDAAWTADEGGFIVKKLNPVLRGVDDALGENQATGYLSLCGHDFFDQLVAHPERRETYKFQNEASDLRGDFHYRQFKYGGVTWVDYRGRGACAIAADSAQLIPLGVPELFRQLFAPADTFQHVNRKGLVKYAFASLDQRTPPRFIDLETQSNPVTFCSRPQVLRTLHAGNA